MLQFFVTLQALLTDRLENDDKGATAVEYALMVSLIAVVIVGAVTALGLNIAGTFTTIVASL